MAVTEGLDDAYAPTAPGTPSPGTQAPRAGGLVGRRIGVYEILEQVGSGGMGVVYRAKDRSLDRDVALKVLQPFLAQDKEYEQRFVREARTAAKLDHPNVVQVYTAGRFEEVLFIAMQFVPGTTLHQHTRARGRFAWREALGIARQAAEALGAAHRAGLVHRDIKPNNIMIDDAGRVKIMDFGLMRSHAIGDAITRSGDFFGTPEYASPEQCETAELDGRSDLYSLGAVLYEMLAGRMPHRAETPMALFKKILEEAPVPLRSLNPEVPPAVEALVGRMMAKKPAERFATAAELVAEIDRVLGGARAAKAPPRRAWAAGIAAAAVPAALAWALFLRPSAPPPVPDGNPGNVTPVSKAERLKLVVFDLKNGLPDPASAWYEIALSDMLIAALAQHPFLDVPSRDQLLWKLKEMRLSGQAAEEDRRVLTQELRADAYLSGHYYAKGGKVRVTLNGFRLSDHQAAFAPKTFEKPEEDLFALVDEVARVVARDLVEVASEVLTRVAPAVEVRPCQELALAWRGGARSEDEAGPRKNAEAAAGKDRSHKEERPAPEPAAPPPARPAAAPAAGGAPALSEKKVASAPPAAAPHARSEPAEDGKILALRQQERRKADLPAPGDGERMRAWYQNRQELEKCRFEREDFEALARGLAAQFQAGPADLKGWQKGLENFRSGIEQARESRGRRVAVEFVCPGCAAASPEFGRCEKCDQYLILKVRIPAGNPEKYK